MKNLIIVDQPRNITLSNSEVISRHINYSKMWAERIGNNSRILIISVSRSLQSISRSRYGNLEFVQLPLSVKMEGITALRNIREELKSQENAFISADPWLKFLAATIFKLLFWLPGKIQVQIHADAYDSKWYKQNYKNSLKRILLPISLLFSCNIRVVSSSTLKKISGSYFGKRKPVYLAPVPLNIDITNLEFHKKDRPLAVGILGRLHQERGLDLVIEYLESYDFDLEGIRFVIAGSGPSEEQFRLSLIGLLGIENVEFLGELDGQDIEIFWRKIGVLFSFAPSESYGRAIRESLCHGIPVLAFPSQGLDNLMAEFPGCAVEVCRFNGGLPDPVDNLRKLLTMETNTNFLQYSRQEQKKNLNTLIDSWEELFE